MSLIPSLSLSLSLSLIIQIFTNNLEPWSPDHWTSQGITHIGNQLFCVLIIHKVYYGNVYFNCIIVDTRNMLPFFHFLLVLMLKYLEGALILPSTLTKENLHPSVAQVHVINLPSWFFSTFVFMLKIWVSTTIWLSFINLTQFVSRIRLFSSSGILCCTYFQHEDKGWEEQRRQVYQVDLCNWRM